MWTRSICPDELYHYGVLGMKWGQRKTDKMAKKDAKEYARAKMYYGEGAGNRRKLIKATVNERSKDPNYKKAFETHLSKQNMADHASKAKGERARADVKKSSGKAFRSAVNIASGNIARASASAIAVYTIARATGADKVAARYVKKGVSVGVAKASGAYKLGKMWFKAMRK